MASYFVTGASRGIGFGLVSTLAARPASEVSVIFATGRTLSTDLENLIQESTGRVIFVPLEVTDKNMVKEAVVKVENVVGDDGLDVLVNNAGIINYAPDKIEQMCVCQKDIVIGDILFIYFLIHSHLTVFVGRI